MAEDEIQFDEGDTLVPGASALSKKSIWLEAFKKMFTEGSKEMIVFRDRLGNNVDQRDVFFNTVVSFHSLAIGELTESKDDAFKDIKDKIMAIDEEINDGRKEISQNINEMGRLNMGRPKDKQINMNNSQSNMIETFKRMKVDLYRQKLTAFSLLMYRLRYMDSYGISD